MGDEMQKTVEANARWFADNDRYVELQSRLVHYQHIARIVRHEVRGVDRLLDVGNGGFFNYDVTVARHVTAVDLFLADGPGSTWTSSATCPSAGWFSSSATGGPPR